MPGIGRLALLLTMLLLPAGNLLSATDTPGRLAVRNAAASQEQTTRASPAAHFTKYWTSKIPPSPRLDAKSGSSIRYLTWTSRGVVANLYAYGIPIFAATAQSAVQHVHCTKPWGVCDLQRLPVPMPPNAQPNTGSDAVLVIVQPSTGRSFEFWQAKKSKSGWTASWGDVVPLAGTGVGGATGSGVSRLAGVIRTGEIADGVIRHALVLSTNNACARSFRVPAIKTDGHSTRSDCLPEGARLQLSPSVDVSAIPGITPGERAVAVALQNYGAYVIDSGAAPAAFSFEKPTVGQDPYPAAGFPWDYWHMPHIPWTRMRVLTSWSGS